MQDYTQLTREQRYQMYGCRQAGLNQRETAQRLKVNKSTISRELRRNCGRRGWRPKQAQALCEARRRHSHGSRIRADEWQRVDGLVQCEWSPAEIRGRLAKEGHYPISHEWIY